VTNLIRSLHRAALLGAALGFALPLAAQDRDRPASALHVAPLAGQPIPVVPITYLVADSVPGVPADRVTALAWADSIVGEALEARGPEVRWVLPPALRVVARRAPSTVPPPDRMGQAALRAPKMDRVPDPLRVYLRSLAALTSSRMIMVPAAVRFTVAPGGVRAEIDFAMADARNGQVVWRSRPSAIAPTAAGALRAAVEYILPDMN
jgi:hypothetical protein